ncbi:hypothetical protein QFC21_004587 [Naganishia friedmannii]|uniref:Uncharacterized protein n=1 Tax=Naganishia friedmannii TaxID=89922 RepID=A0ACC2VFX1_9TREE|nr:hypothetical protein QFC21_004587 [Naganishia friedmannii]
MAVSLGTRPSTIINQPGWTITKPPTSLLGSWEKEDVECLRVSVEPVVNSELEPKCLMTDEFAFAQQPSRDGPTINVNQHIGRATATTNTTKLEHLKQKRRQERAVTKRIKQSLRGEIDSWDVDLGITGSANWNDASSGSCTEGVTAEACSSNGGGWSSWDCTSSTPISDEEWGEDWDWGGDAVNFNELMVVDNSPEQYWWSDQGSKALATEHDRSESGKPPDLSRCLNTDSTSDTTSSGPAITHTGPIILDLSPEPVSPAFPSPPSSKNITLTPISPSLSPKLPSAIPDTVPDSDADINKSQDETLFLSFSTFGLNTPTRKRQHPSSALTLTEDIQRGSRAREQGATGYLDEGLVLHIKKKPFVRSCRI